MSEIGERTDYGRNPALSVLLALKRENEILKKPDSAAAKALRATKPLSCKRA